MLTRRTLLVTTATLTAATAAGLDVALAAPQGKLVGESFFCLNCIANGNVAVEDVERVRISYPSFILIQNMASDARRIESYLHRGIFTPEKKADYYKTYKMELMEAALLLERAGKLDVSEDAHSDEPARIVWTRDGKPYDSGTAMERNDFYRFSHLMNAEDYELHRPSSVIVAQIIE